MEGRRRPSCIDTLRAPSGGGRRRRAARPRRGTPSTGTVMRYSISGLEFTRSLQNSFNFYTPVSTASPRVSSLLNHVLNTRACVLYKTRGVSRSVAVVGA